MRCCCCRIITTTRTDRHLTVITQRISTLIYIRSLFISTSHKEKEIEITFNNYNNSKTNKWRNCQ